MGRLRKVLVGAVAAMATLAAGLVGAGTANANPVEKIEIDSTGTPLVASRFKAYRIVSYPDSVSGTTGPDVTSITPGRVSYDLENAIAKAMNEADGRISYVAPGPSNEHPNGAAEGELLNLTRSDNGATLAHVASVLAGQSSILGSNVGTAGTVGDNVLISGLEPGLYLVTDSDPGAKPIIVSTTLKSGNQGTFNGETIGKIDVKNASSYTPKKSYQNAAGVGNSSDEPYVAVGDYAKFTITMTIPDSASYQSFRLEDMPSGYTLDFNNDATNPHHMVITAGSGASATTYTVTSATNQNLGTNTGTSIAFSGSGVPAGGFVITDNQFRGDPNGKDASWLADNRNNNSLLAKHSNKTLTVTYWAEVTDPGAVNSVGSQLTDYSGNKTPEPGKSVKNGNVGEPLAQLTKVAATNRDTKLGGAKFTLTSGTGASTQYWTKSGDTWSHSGTEAKLTTSSDTGTLGQINLDGLSSGKYKLTETDAPADYMQTLTPGVNTTTITINIDDNGKVTASADDSTAAGLFKIDSGTGTARQFKTTTVTVDGIVVKYTITPDSDHAGSQLDFSLGNLHNISELPATGGAGIIAGIILVALLLAIGGSFIAISRKMHKDRQQAEGVRA